MYNSNLLYGNQNLKSVISDGCDLITAFGKVLTYFDPNKNKNYKSKILDCSYSQLWNEKDMRLYSISQTKNLTGNITNNKFDIIVFEPQRNKNFYQESIKYSKIFTNLLNPESIIITKMNDFKEKGSNQLYGSFEIYDIFSDEGLYLYDNIVYNFHRPSNTCNVHDRVEIIHMYFMIFKKKQGDKNEVSKN